MKYIQFDSNTMTVSVTDAEQPEGVNIAVAEPDIVNDNPYHSRIPVASTIYVDVLYAALEAQDRREGKNIQYFLVPPDPWLVALGLVMWEGIVQGLTWDTVKVLVRTALHKLRHEGVAPMSDNHQTTRKERLELGFCWVQYANEKKLNKVFVGLRKSFENKTKAVEKRKVTKRTKKKIK